MQSKPLLLRRWYLFLMILPFLACNIFPPLPPTESVESNETPGPVSESESSPTVEIPVIGPEPSYRVAAFYYPWYGSQDFDGRWIHWDQNNNLPPDNIGTDFYPQLGPYSSMDPVVVAQHFAWLRQAGVGIIVTSWWGQGSLEDQAVPLLLDTGETYGIKVAFHIENYDGRTASSLVDDIKYLYSQYGDHPAFFRTNATSRWSPEVRPKGLFYLWASIAPNPNFSAVAPDYWREALDTIHALPGGGIVLSDNSGSEWVFSGHFDGLYSYGGDEETRYAWARGLPPGAWYVPGVNPGFASRRIDYPPGIDVPRQDGTAYNNRWEWLLGIGLEPELVTITTFNEWHEGTQIEPAAPGVIDRSGNPYLDYESLPPDGYLSLTKQWVESYLATSWPDSGSERIRVRLTTTSDWTTFNLVSGASWLRPDVISTSENTSSAGLDVGKFVLNQPIEQAEGGGLVEMIVDIQFTGWQEGQVLLFEIERGHLGYTRVELFKYVENEPLLVKEYTWSGIKSGSRNASTFQVTPETLFPSLP
jgi:glycoprotein endo-alpha-1,2-mannosidase